MAPPEPERTTAGCICLVLFLLIVRDCTNLQALDTFRAFPDTDCSKSVDNRLFVSFSALVLVSETCVSGV